MDELERATAADENSRSFLLALTEISRRYGIGIAGEAVLFVMERDDGNLSYTIDAASRLAF